MPISLTTFVSVFHRILDFKTGQDFHPSPFFIFSHFYLSGDLSFKIFCQ